LAANDLCGETEFTRAQEYQALRQYLKLAERQSGTYHGGQTERGVSR
jgi:hypothetical protein